jgi:hypothetical protein
MKFFLLSIFFMLALPLISHAQDLNTEEESWHQGTSEEQTKFSSSPNIFSEEGEEERQEDLNYPEGEENGSLGSEDLASEELE